MEHSSYEIVQDDPKRRERWRYLTDGVKGDKRRVLTEIMLQNQADMLTARSNRGPMFEDVITTSNVLPFTTFAYPIIRRVFPNLIANDLVSVQPMTQPTGKIFYLDFNYAAAGSPPVVHRNDLTANFQGSYAQAAEATQVQQLGLSVESIDVSATTKKLSAKWSMESEQDLFAYHGINAENELMTALADEIGREIDRGIINAMFSFAAAGNVTWNYTVPGSGPYATLDPKVYNRTLFDAIVDANNLVFNKRYQNTNWIVAGTTTCGRLEKLDEFRLFPAPDPTAGQIAYGPHLFGTISGRFTVVKDPWLDATLGAEKMLLGYKGSRFMDASYVYAPYIPLLTTAPFTDPNTLTTVRAMMTRYAQQGVLPDALATVTIVA